MSRLNWKRFIALLLTALMVLSLAACKGTKDPEPTSGENTQETTAVKPTEAVTQAPTQAPVTGNITVNFHYYREDGAYNGWNVWLWITDGKAYQFGETVDDNGVSLTAQFPAGTEKIGYIVRLNEWEKKDIESDQFIEMAGVISGTLDVFVTSGKEGCEVKFGADCVRGLGVKTAVMDDDYMTINIALTDSWSDGAKLILRDKDNKEVSTGSITADSTDPTKLIINLSERADQMGKYTVELNGVKKAVEMPDYFSSVEFEEKYTYNGNDLGANYTKTSTTFKVWAPTVKAMTLNLYKGGTKGISDQIDKIEMTAADHGVWTATVEGDQNGVFYTYTADFGSYKTFDICDPYAKAVGVNGNRAMVIDLAGTNPEGWDKDQNPNTGLAATDAIIYELSIRDTTVDASAGNSKPATYLGLIERGTTNANGNPTGLDHIVGLGVTHVQLMPSYDFATVDETASTYAYNWGYDPKNYNVPEGSFSSDPRDGAARVKEYKQMVMGLHAAGLSVNMDVVYNHTYNTEYCFNQLVPGYFYRPGSNGSGCGNDVASERSMVRKFIVDSVTYWASEYHLDGFRFDLVGLLDTQTINEIRASVDTVNKGIMLYGEGWSMSTKLTKKGISLATQQNVKYLNNFAMFNDSIRDSLKGSVFDATAKGYINGITANAGAIASELRGFNTWVENPSQRVNYTSCHDNLTLWDEINSSNGSDPLEEKIRQNLLAASIVYSAQGIPFILSGEEILRTKTKEDGSFDSNSYVSPDSVNSMKWDTLADADYQLVLNYYKGMIAFRKAHASLTQMVDARDCYTKLETPQTGVIAFLVAPADGEVSDGIVMIFNPTKEPVTVELPDGDWTICVQGTAAGTDALGTATGSVAVEGISATILVKGATK